MMKWNPVLIATFHDINAEKLEEEAAGTRQAPGTHHIGGGHLQCPGPVISRLNLTRIPLNFIYVRWGS